MKLLLDQNIDHRLAVYLRALGHDVTAIAYDYPHGLNDQEVLAIAVREQRLLINYDHADFGELIFRYDHPHCGVILLRLLTLQDVPLKTRNNDCSTSSRTFKNTSTISWSSRRKRYAYAKP